ncbi:hypothetical protein [Xanthomonas sacchari]|uniref:hypothetical protein n=1 Tax=Xanthomonas sacchari TaxID=56458 RepID=UPI002257EADC|nr:hypothetical protein [Xanthomonas sacchari]
MYGDPLGLFDLPSIPQPVVDAVAGFGDSLSFGLTNYIRDQWDINGAVEKCSGYYSGGQVAGTVLAMPLSRLGYVAKARQIPRLGLSAEESVIARNALKNYFRGPFAYSLRNWQAVTYEGLVAQGKSGADIIAGAGRTSIGWTSVLVGGGLVGGGLVGSATRAGRIGGNCGCGQ